MKLLNKILLYEIHNTIRSKWIIIYTFFFFLVGYTLFTLSGDVNKAYISLMNIVLIVIPLVSLIFGAVYLYNSREFLEMMLSQPIDKRSLFLGIYFGVSIPLVSGYIIGIITPFLIFGKVNEQTDGLVFLLLIGAALTFVFTAISFLVTVLQDDKAKGLGIIILIWLVFSVIYDGIVLFIVYYFQEYPLENIMIGLSVTNPIDLGRILFLIKFNISALMGYTGAVFQKFFGSSFGVILSAICIILWVMIPIVLGNKVFKKKDF